MLSVDIDPVKQVAKQSKQIAKTNTFSSFAAPTTSPTNNANSPNATIFFHNATQ